MLVLVNLCSPPYTTVWTSLGFNFTATSSIQTLAFRFDVGSSDRYYLDEVSVTRTNGSATQLLTNPNFESSSSSIVGWTTSCSGACGSAASITSGGACFSSSRCVIAQCSSVNEVVSQSITTVPGLTYSVTFQLRLNAGGGSAASNRFYVDIY